MGSCPFQTLKLRERVALNFGVIGACLDALRPDRPYPRRSGFPSGRMGIQKKILPWAPGTYGNLKAGSWIHGRKLLFQERGYSNEELESVMVFGIRLCVDRVGNGCESRGNRNRFYRSFERAGRRIRAGLLQRRGYGGKEINAAGGVTVQGKNIPSSWKSWMTGPTQPWRKTMRFGL